MVQSEAAGCWWCPEFSEGGRGASEGAREFGHGVVVNIKRTRARLAFFDLFVRLDKHDDCSPPPEMGKFKRP